MDYYEILELSKAATHQDIKTAYRRLVKAFHPDSQTHQASHERIVLINAAYEVLSDPQRRRQYDQGRHSLGRDRETRDRQAAQAYHQGHHQRQQVDRQREEWIAQVYAPIMRGLHRIMNALDSQIDHLAADLFDDDLMADFQAYLADLETCLGDCRHQLGSVPNPQSLAKIAAFLYYALNHVEDALEELTAFTLSYDDSCLHHGIELFRLTQDLLDEAQVSLADYR